MSNRTAFLLFMTVVILIATIALLFDGPGLFLARRFADLVEWIAFWR